MSPRASSSVLLKASTAILDLLGWHHAKVGSKALDFASDFNALGIHVQLKQLHRGSFVLANKEGRVDKIVSMLREVSTNGYITRAKAAEIQGHINFGNWIFCLEGAGLPSVGVWALGRLAKVLWGD